MAAVPIIISVIFVMTCGVLLAYMIASASGGRGLFYTWLGLVVLSGAKAFHLAFAESADRSTGMEGILLFILPILLVLVGIASIIGYNIAEKRGHLPKHRFAEELKRELAAKRADEKAKYDAKHRNNH